MEREGNRRTDEAAEEQDPDYCSTAEPAERLAVAEQIVEVQKQELVRARKDGQVRTGQLVDAVGLDDKLGLLEVQLVLRRFEADCQPYGMERHLPGLEHVLCGHLLLV